MALSLIFQSRNSRSPIRNRQYGHK